jgi:hypothetical protein
MSVYEIGGSVAPHRAGLDVQCTVPIWTTMVHDGRLDVQCTVHLQAVWATRAARERNG